jgi:hypothetical protein
LGKIHLGKIPFGKKKIHFEKNAIYKNKNIHSSIQRLWLHAIVPTIAESRSKQNGIGGAGTL